MDQYCVVLCGLHAAAADEAAAWQPVAAALKLDHADFERRVIAALPRIVRQGLDQATAERIAQVLQAQRVDARVLPDDSQLVYIKRAGASCGPLPQSALGDFIQPGDSYRLRGDKTWRSWPEPAELLDAMPPPLRGAPTGEPANTPESAGDMAATVSEPDPAVSARDDEPVEPTQETFSPDALAASDPATPEVTVAAAPKRSRTGRLVMLVVLVALAVWAYRHLTASTRDAAPPAAASATQPADAGQASPAARVVPGAAPTPVPASPASATLAAPVHAAAASASAAATAGSFPAAAAATAVPATSAH